METKSTLWTEIIWWELRRIVFNFVLLVSGLLCLFIVEIIKPIHSQTYFTGYFELIVAYGLFANFAYTAVYMFLLRLGKRFIELANIQQAIKAFTYKSIVMVGFMTNLFGAGLELLFRLNYVK